MEKVRYQDYASQRRLLWKVYDTVIPESSRSMMRSGTMSSVNVDCSLKASVWRCAITLAIIANKNLLFMIDVYQGAVYSG